MHIDHAARHFDFRVEDVILFVYQQYDATVLIIQGCRCVNAMMVSAIFINKIGEIILIFVTCLQKGCYRDIRFWKLIIKKNIFCAVHGAAARPCHIWLDGFERNRKRVCISASRNTGETLFGSQKIASDKGRGAHDPACMHVSTCACTTVCAHAPSLVGGMGKDCGKPKTIDV